ncbi:MAG: hypothetical protein R3F11_12030 [Verrucomicrobiales bacterium]
MSDTAPTHPEANPLQASKEHAQQAAQELRSAAEHKVQQLRGSAEQKAEQFRDYAETTWQDAKLKANDLLEEGEKYVRENPTRSILTAVGVGFVLGLIFRR